jgi:hypothetical protein
MWVRHELVLGRRERKATCELQGTISPMIVSLHHHRPSATPWVVMGNVRDRRSLSLSLSPEMLVLSIDTPNSGVWEQAAIHQFSPRWICAV